MYSVNDLFKDKEEAYRAGKLQGLREFSKDIANSASQMSVRAEKESKDERFRAFEDMGAIIKHLEDKFEALYSIGDNK